MTNEETIAALKTRLDLERRAAERLVEDISDIAAALGIETVGIRDARTHILQRIAFLQMNQKSYEALVQGGSE